MKTKGPIAPHSEIQHPDATGQTDLVGFYVDSAYTLQISMDLAHETHPAEAHRNAITSASLVYHAMTGDELELAIQNVIAMVPKQKLTKGARAGW